MPMVDESLRRKFESDWMAGKPGRLDEYLPPVDSESYLPTLEELVCIDLEFHWSRPQHKSSWNLAEKNPSGLHSNGRPLLESYLEQFPELREPARVQRLIDQEIYVRGSTADPPEPKEYERRFPDFEITPSIMRRMFGSFATVDQTPTKAPTLSTMPKSMGDYQFLRRLGRGGMGSVYEVKHGPTDRVVALKIADVGHLPDIARRDALLRVNKEIRAAAQCHDDHLVPVLDVGEVDGNLYYTMPVFDTDLASELRERPMSSRQAADFVCQASRGIQAAHQNDLLHRDIKPHNMMLDREKQRVLVADFGLARQTTDEDQLTRTGQLLGTPAFAAPEQLKDPRAADARADIYSLGASLYYLLTSRPPFAAADPVETIRQVFDNDPLAPIDLNPAIDLDLNTICLKCLQKDPALRYQTAESLADDLDRYLNDEPILARPLGPLARLNRWRKRHPKLALATGGLFLSLVACLVIGWIGWWSTQAQLKRAITLRTQTLDQLDEVFTEIENAPAFRRAGSESFRRNFLGKARKHYAELAALESDDPRVLGDQFVAEVKVGMLTYELDGPAPAVDLLRDAVAGHARLPSAARGRSSVAIALGDAHNALGRVFRDLDDLETADSAFAAARSVREKIVKANPADVEAARKLANSIMNRGIVLARLGRIDEAIGEQTIAQTQRKRLLESAPDNERLERDYAQGQFGLARIAYSQGDAARTDLLLADATERFEKLVGKRPDAETLWGRLVQCRLFQLIADFTVVQTPEASEQLNKTIGDVFDTLQPLAVLSPANRSYRLTLIDLYQQAIDQALALQSGEAVEKAEVAWEKANEELFAKFEPDDEQPDLLRRQLEHARLRALISLGLNQREKAKAELLEAIGNWETYREAHGSRDAELQALWERMKAFADTL